MMGWVDRVPMPLVRTIGVLEILGAAGLILPPLIGIALARRRRGDVRDQFRRYCEMSPPSAYRRWSKTLVDLPA